MDKKKKIIIGITGNLQNDQRMQRIALALHEDAWDVLLVYRNYYKYKKPELENKQVYPYKTIGLNISFKSGILFYKFYNFILILKLLFKRTDMYYAVDSDTLPAFTFLSIIRMNPMVYDAHEYFSEVPELVGKNFKKKIWHLVTMYGVKRAKICISVGEALCIELEKRYKKKFHCIRNVPVLEKIPSEQKFEKPVVVYQGALNAGRMLEVLIETMKSLPEFHCIIAGEGDLSSTLREQAKGYENIEFAGLLSPAELKKLSPKCFVGYNTLDASGSLSYYYSLSNKYFDYMHANIPSISSKLPEYEKLNAKWKCGVCIENSSDALKNTLLEMKNNTVYYAELKENAKFAVAFNNWDQEKKVLTDLIKI